MQVATGFYYEPYRIGMEKESRSMRGERRRHVNIFPNDYILPEK